MGLFVVDETRCKHDGICAAECPMAIIGAPDRENVPVPLDNAEELCIQCGHCVAVCPHQAFSLNTMSPQDCTEMDASLCVSPEQAALFLSSRRSIRAYKDKPVERDLIERVIQTVRYAPSGHNRQPVRWMVIYDRETVHQLAGQTIDWMRYMLNDQPDFAKLMHMDRAVEGWESGRDSICRNAPHLIIAYADKNDRTAPAACTIALTYLELAAHSLGLGTCWAGYFHAAAMYWPPLQKTLAFAEDNAPFGAMMIGYPKFKYHRLPVRNEPRIEWR